MADKFNLGDIMPRKRANVVKAAPKKEEVVKEVAKEPEVVAIVPKVAPKEINLNGNLPIIVE